MLKWSLTSNLLVFLIVSSSLAQGKYRDPDSPEVEMTARQALANAMIRPIEGKVLDIVGISRGIEAVLEELGAKVTEQEVRIALSADVLFEFNKYDIRPAAAESLKKVGQVIKGFPHSPLLIEGYTDSKGSDEYNLKLSDQRAASVRTWLVENERIDPARITTRGWGEAKPVAPNANPDGSDNPEGRRKNRRVEITIKTQHETETGKATCAAPSTPGQRETNAAERRALVVVGFSTP